MWISTLFDIIREERRKLEAEFEAEVRRPAPDAGRLSFLRAELVDRQGELSWFQRA